MLPSSLQIIPTDLLSVYSKELEADYLCKYKELLESEISKEDFRFYTSVSAVFSSKIEGEEIDIDSYLKHKCFGIKFRADYTQKTDDLYVAYQFAKTTICNRQNVEKAHALLTKHILPKNRQGKTRNSIMYVMNDEGKIEYVAADPFTVEAELSKFYSDLELLTKAELTVHEVFYFAAMLHLVFVKIHPMDDGNGRTARLLEKWFLALKLGEQAWFIQSEKNYYLHHQSYYQALRMLGLEYETLNYSLSMPFLRMLPSSLEL